MANTVSIDALRQELWSKELLDDVQRDILLGQMGLLGENANNVIQIKRDLAKMKGDQQTFGLVTRLTGSGVTGDSELEGQEESMNSFAEVVAIDQIRHAVRLVGQLDNQKVFYDQLDQAKEKLRIWMAEFLEQQAFLKLGGVTNTSLTNVAGDVVGTRATWSNTPDFIPDADTAAGTGNRYLNADSDGADSLQASDTMTLDLVTEAATKARLASPRIQPIRANDGGEPFYVMFLHPYQARDIRKSSDWKTAQQDAQRRGERNPVFRGALGYWSNVLLIEHEMVPWLDVSVAGNSFRGSSSGTDFAVDAARALLCGRQAGLIAEAANPRALVVKTFDYENKEGAAINYIGGVQKAVFNSKEFGVIAVDTAAAA